jgi:hypothetical protein
MAESLVGYAASFESSCISKPQRADLLSCPVFLKQNQFMKLGGYNNLGQLWSKSK